MRDGILVTGWFDESGSVADSSIALVAGFVALPGADAEVTKQWGLRLHEDGLQHFSMKHAMGFGDNFSTWADQVERRDVLLRDLAKIVSVSPLIKITAIVMAAFFNALPDIDLKKFGGDPLYCSIETCIRSILDSDDRFSLHYVHDLTEKSAQFMKRFNRIRARDQIIRERCVAVTFADDTCHYGIQMADMASYCARKALEGAGEPIVSEVHALLTAKDQKHGHFLYKSGELVQGST